MSKTPHYVGHRKRLKQKFRENSQVLEDYEILELLLGYGLPRKDTKPLAKELLSRFGSLKGVFHAGPQELRKVPGLGQGLELFWLLLQEFWARLGSEQLPRKEALSSPLAVLEAVRRRIGFSGKESFWLALVDNKNRLLDLACVSQGTVDQACVYPREIFRPALEIDASGIILVHNHPGGDPRPSVQDQELTRRLQGTGQELGLRILDHLIVAEDSYYSFKEQGLL
ncbi:MAG: DNA repair protein RadC [Desulfohalobiaceae bacterium]